MEIDVGMEKNLSDYISVIKCLNNSIMNLIENKDIFNIEIQHEIHAVKREINNIDTMISEQRNSRNSNKKYIAFLAEKQRELCRTRNELVELDNELTILHGQMAGLYSTANFNLEIINKLSEQEINFLILTRELELPNSINKSRISLLRFMKDIQSYTLCKFLNDKFQLTGFKKLYVEENKINSHYITDLVNTIEDLCNENNYRSLVSIVQGKYGVGNQKTSCIKILNAIFYQINNRKSIQKDNHMNLENL